jgi:uncharacterized protein YggE
MKTSIGAAFAVACLMAAALPGAAQTPATRIMLPPSVLAGGINVQGHATVRRPADIARFTIVVGDRQSPTGGLSGADALAAALKRAGVDDAAVSTPLNNFINVQSFATVVGTLRKPTPAGVRALVTAVQSALPAGTVAIQNVSFALGLDDCTDAETIAEQVALDDARTHAQRLANAAHVELGPVVTINAIGSNGAACPSRPDRVWQQGQQFEPSQSGSFDVVIGLSLNVTFTIK